MKTSLAEGLAKQNYNARPRNARRHYGEESRGEEKREWDEEGCGMGKEKLKGLLWNWVKKKEGIKEEENGRGVWKRKKKKKTGEGKV